MTMTRDTDVFSRITAEVRVPQPRQQGVWFMADLLAQPDWAAIARPPAGRHRRPTRRRRGWW